MEKPRKLENSYVGAVGAQAGGPLQSTSAKTLIGVQRGLKFVKSPRWIGQELLFLDVHDRCIKSANLEGSVQIVRKLEFLPGGFDVHANGDLVTGDAWHRKIYRWGAAGSNRVVDLIDIPGFCFNDGIVDDRDGMYFSESGYDLLDPLVDPESNGTIIYIDAEGNSSVVASDLFLPSGMVITPDNRTLIVAETQAHRLTAFDIRSNGSLQNRRVRVQFADDIKPDGICLDCDNTVWVAGGGKRVLRVREGSEIVRQITTERPVFATMLGGPERRHLFMCTSDSNDPVITSRARNATIDIAEVVTPGCYSPKVYR